MPAWAKDRAPADLAVTVPVWFHVITNGSLGTRRPSRSPTRWRVLNNGFDGDEGGDNTGFSFTLAGMTRTDNPMWFATSRRCRARMKQALKQGGPGT